MGHFPAFLSTILRHILRGRGGLNRIDDNDDMSSRYKEAGYNLQLETMDCQRKSRLKVISRYKKSAAQLLRKSKIFKTYDELTNLLI